MPSASRRSPTSSSPLLGPALGHTAAIAISVIIAYVLITFAQTIFGEMVPKLYVIQHAEGVLRRIARPLQMFRVLFHPFIVLLTGSSNRLLRLLGTDPDAEPEAGTPEELKRLIAQSTTGGQLDVGEANMLTGVFHLHEQEARQVMTPIPAVVTVDVSETVEEALRRCVSTGHSRLVVTEDVNQDRVKGIVHVNQLVKVLMNGGDDAHFDRVVREAPLVPETKPLDDLLADLQRERTELAIVIDEYGRTAGMVTIEDIIEEVVGEISDETDPAGGAVRRLANGDWFVRGHVAVSDLRGLRPRAAGRHRRLQLGGRVRVRRARTAAQARRLDLGQRLLDPRRVGPREPDRGGADQAAAGRVGERSAGLIRPRGDGAHLCARLRDLHFSARLRIIRYISAQATAGTAPRDRRRPYRWLRGEMKPALILGRLRHLSSGFSGGPRGLKRKPARWGRAGFVLLGRRCCYEVRRDVKDAAQT